MGQWVLWALEALEILFRAYGSVNHLEERPLDQAQARASYTPPFWGSFA